MTPEKLEEGRLLKIAIDHCTAVAEIAPEPVEITPTNVITYGQQLQKLESLYKVDDEDAIDADVKEAIDAACLGFVTAMNAAIAALKTTKQDALTALEAS